MIKTDKVEIKDKILLTVEEAGALSNLGTNLMREIIKKYGDAFALKAGANGGKVLINRHKFESFINNINTL